MFIDYKVCIWKRMYIPEGKEEIVLEKLKEGYSIGNLFDDEEINSDANLYPEDLFETEEELSVEDNGRCHTIEVYEDDKSIWTNQIKNNEKD